MATCIQLTRGTLRRVEFCPACGKITDILHPTVIGGEHCGECDRAIKRRKFTPFMGPGEKAFRRLYKRFVRGEVWQDIVCRFTANDPVTLEAVSTSHGPDPDMRIY